mmetsp:Transcript_121880/g.339758  ORF Transcript_121880/g.339758 Transcript_121880/m.339758 type:complete len:468 (+) Transcript_121880:133-1536(+)
MTPVSRTRVSVGPSAAWAARPSNSALSASSRFIVQPAQLGQLVGNLQLQAARHGRVPALACEPVGQVLLAGRVSIRLVMRVAVGMAVAQLLHQPGRRIAQVHRHGPRHVLLDEGTHRVEGLVDGVGLGRHRQVNHGLGQGQLAFGGAQALVGLGRVQRDAQRARVGQADVFTRHADQPAGDVAGIHAAIQHAREPVQRAVRAAAAHRFVQRGDDVVELVAALVVAAQLLAQRPLQQGLVDGCPLGQRGRGVEGIQKPARVTVGIADQPLGGLGRGRRHPELGRAALDQLAELVGVQALEHLHRGPRQQRRIDLEARVLGRRADEGEEPRLDVRQEGILLRLVEAVHLVDEHHRAPALRRGDLGALDRLADLLHAAEHRRDRDELRIEGAGHQPRQRRLADARRAPQDHAVQPAGVKGHAQRHAGPEQVALADDLVQGLGPQALGQRDAGQRRRGRRRGAGKGLVVEQ